MTKRILIVDDEADICEILRFNLEMEGYEVMTADGAETGQDILNQQSVDLILLDVMMTHKSGFEWAQELKKNAATADIPIIFCTAKTMEDDLLLGFALGSDDYICKPFRISEVKARVKAVLRRTNPEHPSADETSKQPSTDSLIRYEGMVLDIDRKECRIDGEEVIFTKIEFEILALLLSKAGQVLSRERILNAVWPSDTIVLDRTVDVNITRIRKKIGRYGECLRTKFGYGYMFSR
ncbi:MAG: response regulator transcription factor [Bacteroidales bacterium]|nr:response regulator transcription factor [Bacteroidales bacterium]